MASVEMQKFRENLKEAMDFVRFKNGRVTVLFHGKPVAELVPVSREQRAQLPCPSHPATSETAQGSQA